MTKNMLVYFFKYMIYTSINFYWVNKIQIEIGAKICVGLPRIFHYGVPIKGHRV